MITASQLQELVNLNKKQLSQVLESSGYTRLAFKKCQFLGLTNGGQFCYSITYYDESGTGETQDKVYITRQPSGCLVAGL